MDRANPIDIAQRRPGSRPPGGPGLHSLWLSYAGLCLLCWLLYTVAGTEWQRGPLRLGEAAYEASWSLWPPMLIGALALPWAGWLQGQRRGLPANWLLHGLGALGFAALWQGLDFVLAWAFFGAGHASATFEQRVLWRTVWAVFVYLALVLGFGGALHARRAQAAALGAAQAESALVRAELAAISGKLNPHFLFNTLNTLMLLTRKDAAAAEQALLGFSRMMRYLLDSQRGAADRVSLQDELDFVRDYLALETLRLGPRLHVEWQIDAQTLGDQVPPLTLQPLVENSILHGIAPQVAGGLVRIEARRADGPALHLRVSDDGAGCAWPPADPASAPASGIGLRSLQRRFELDYDGRARLDIRSAPGAGFCVEILIPQAEAE